MELYEANRILRNVKAAVTTDGYKLPSSAETDGLMMLLGKLDAEKYLAPKIRHAQAQNHAAPDERSVKLLWFFRALQTITSELPDPVTAVSMMMLHKKLCGDVDPDAGKLRTNEVLTNGNAHTDPRYVAGSLKSIAVKMNEIESSPTISKEDFAGYLSHYMRELIILHPFERGSEFTVRIFIYMFCKVKGFSLCYYRTSPYVIKSAESDALAADDIAPIYKMLAACMSYEQKTLLPPRPEPPRTRREMARDLCRPQRAQAPRTAIEQKPNTDDKAKKNAADDEVLKRAVRLQQKISKLNEQLTELMRQRDEQ